MQCAATIFAKHLDALASFYEASLDLQTVAQAPGDYRVLESETMTLSIVQVPDAVAAMIEVSDPPRRRAETPIKLSFDVPSIAAARRRITNLGAQVDEPEWEFRGFRHCDFVDPEGNVNQLREAL